MQQQARALQMFEELDTETDALGGALDRRSRNCGAWKR
jgi:hypothetical protein